MRIIYFYSKKWFETKMSPGRILYAKAVARRAGVQLRFWGIGWEGYDAKATLAENIAKDAWEPTHLWFYKAFDYQDVADVHLPKLVVFNEAHDTASAVAEIKAASATHVCFHHENDFLRWHGAVPGAFHLPHAALPYTNVTPLAQRLFDCIVTGRASKESYPLRHRMVQLINGKCLPGIVREHPGYILDGHAGILKQYDSYREDLQKARMGLGCSSIYRYNLSRFAELAMAGTVIVTDKPNDETFRRTLGEASIIIPDGASRWRIIAMVREVLRDPAALQQRANWLRQTAERELSIESYAENLVDIFSAPVGRPRRIIRS
jgi:hypothetical protein